MSSRLLTCLTARFALRERNLSQNFVNPFKIFGKLLQTIFISSLALGSSLASTTHQEALHDSSVTAPSSAKSQNTSNDYTVTLLNQVGHFLHPINSAQATLWKQELSNRPAAIESATLHLWLGEYELAHNQQPVLALQHFQQTWSLTSKSDGLHDLAAYDGALARFYGGEYLGSEQGFQSLLNHKESHRLYDYRVCALWYRHAHACAGYHTERANMGIPEPPQLDPLCGVAALATALKSFGLPYDKKSVVASCHVTGEGNSLADLEVAGAKLGVIVHAVTADEQGLIGLPKPIIAHVEHDHFIAVTRADKNGVSYLCSDCGSWPGGQVDLTWSQWRMLEADMYGVVCHKGDQWDQELSNLVDKAASRVKSEPQLRVASIANLNGLRAHLSDRKLDLLINSIVGKHVFKPIANSSVAICDRLYSSLHCPHAVPGVEICCAMDGRPGNGTGNSKPHEVSAFDAGPSAGDPVNLGTGEEEYAPAPDLVVYNPNGPAVEWNRTYNSLTDYQTVDCLPFGWKTNYSWKIQSETNDSEDHPSVIFHNLILPNGAVIAIPASGGWPTVSTPHVDFTVPVGYGILASADYDGPGPPFSSYANAHITITFADRSKWITSSSTSDGRFFPAKMLDRNGNGLQINIDPSTEILSSITDVATGHTLLTVNNTTFGGYTYVSSVTDCYGRSVYYQYGTSSTGYKILTGVSQVVPSSVTSATALSMNLRYTYGYQVGPPTDGAPYLNQITVPSPTGSGASTTTINYTSGLVTSVVDGNGNNRSYDYTSAGTNRTKVTVSNAANQVVYSYTAGYNADMSETMRTDGKGNTIESRVYSDPNDPYRPSSVTDANGKTTSYTWDSFSNVLTETPPSNGTRTPAATTYTYDYTKFALGELMRVQQGSKGATSYAYDDQAVTGGYLGSGLLLSVTMPAPGSVGNGAATVTTTYNYDLTTYNTSRTVAHQGLGVLLSVATPGNNAAGTITTTYNYTSDPGDSTHGVAAYSQSAAIDQPLTSTNNLGKVTHFRYDSRSNTTVDIDALGNETDSTYNIADQPLLTTFAATGQQGSGHSQHLNSYLYPAGPLTGETIYDEAGAAIRQVNYSYGAEGETLGVSGSAEPATYTYDAYYRVIGMTDGGSHTTHFYYKSQGYLDSITFPGYAGPAPIYNSASDGYTNVTGADSLRFPSYDLNGNLLTRVDGNGVTTTYTHSADPESLLTLIHYTYPGGYTGGTAGDVSLSYDAYGRRLGMTDGTGSQAYSYSDDDSRLTVVTTYAGLAAKTVSYGYWPDGSRSSMTTPAGGFSYNYDAVGKMTGLTNPNSETTSWSYLDNNWLWKRTLSNGAVTAHTYNALGQTTDLLTKNSGGTTLSDFSSQVYDGAGNLTTRSASLPAAPASYSGTNTYTYDGGLTVKRGQLTQESSTRGGGYTNAFAYDGGTATGPGNPTSFKGASHSYNADNQATGNTYDGNGNPTTYGGHALAFDPEGRMTAYASTTLTASYTGDGLRAWKQTSAGKVYFLYDEDEPVCELNSSGSVTFINTFGDDGLISRHAGATTVFYTFDPSGNVAQRLSSSGGVTTSDQYDGFGARQSTGSSDVFGYGAQLGYYTDAEIGLILCTHRYYDPAAGRWLNRDPIGYAGGVNLYAYCENDPVNSSDPSGFKKIQRTIVVNGRKLDTAAFYNCLKGLESKIKASMLGQGCCDAVKDYFTKNESKKWYDLGFTVGGCLAESLEAGPGAPEEFATCVLKDILKDIAKDCIKGALKSMQPLICNCLKSSLREKINPKKIVPLISANVKC